MSRREERRGRREEEEVTSIPTNVSFFFFFQCSERFSGAIDDLTEATQLDYLLSPAFHTLGLAYQMAGKTKKKISPRFCPFPLSLLISIIFCPVDASRQLESEGEGENGSEGVDSEGSAYLQKAIDSYSNCLQRFAWWFAATRATRSPLHQQPSSTEEKCMICFAHM